jgi:hypothetical protein
VAGIVKVFKDWRGHPRPLIQKELEVSPDDDDKSRLVLHQKEIVLG